MRVKYLWAGLVGLGLACSSEATTDAVETVAGASVVDGAQVHWVRDHEKGLGEARAAGKPVMIDFTADWCLPCKELDKKTYSAREVTAEAERFVSVKVDATEPDAATQKVLQTYGVMNLPTVVFVDSRGAVLPTPRVTRFIEAREMLALMKQVH